MARKPKTETSTATIDFEAKHWLTADKLRNNMDAAEYKHVVLGLIFLKYISDTFEEHRAKLIAGQGDYAGADAVPQIGPRHLPISCGGKTATPAANRWRYRFAFLPGVLLYY